MDVRNKIYELIFYQMKNYLIYIVLFFLSTNVALSQSQFDTSIFPTPPPSPNADELGFYGKVPISHFTGNPNINIPIYNISNSQLSLPINLSYHLSTVKPSRVPDWTGIGWTLNAGGVITRIMKGKTYDEIYVPHEISEDPNTFSYFYRNDILNSQNWNDDANFLKYIYERTIPSAVMNHQELENWSNLPPFQKLVPDLEPDEYLFNFNGYTGSFFLDHNGNWVVKSNDNIKIEINEEIVNDFQLPYNYNVIYQNETYVHEKNPEPSPLNLKRIIYGFTLSTPDGVKYRFGLNDSAIEFTQTSSAYAIDNQYSIVATAWYLTEIIPPGSSHVEDDPSDPIGPVDPWPGDEPGSYAPITSNNIKLTYSRDKFAVHIAQLHHSYTKTSGGGVPNGEKIHNIWYRLFKTYLYKIETANTVVQFDISHSDDRYKHGKSAFYYKEQNQISQPLYDNFKDLFANFNSSDSNSNYYYEPFFNAYQNKRYYKWYKLGKITVKTLNDDKVKQIFFNYRDNVQDILRLESLSFQEGSKKEKKYSFSYNGSYPALRYTYCIKQGEDDCYGGPRTGYDQYPPNTLSLAVDHWGYYNGNMETYELKNYPSLSESILRQNYFDIRNSDEDLLKKETLKSITYPTGGYTEFEYEENKFSHYLSKKITDIEFDSQQQPKLGLKDSIGQGGGLRIKSISNFEKDGSLLNKKEYEYVYNNSMSSGILSGKPTYFFDVTTSNNSSKDIFIEQFPYEIKSFVESYLDQNYGVGNLFLFSNNSQNILSSTNGADVTYSQVKEKQTGNGEIIYNFSNSDEIAHRDYHPIRFPGMVSGNIDQFENGNFSRLDLDRGRLLSKKIFNNQYHLIREEAFTYEKPQNWEDFAVRNYQNESKTFNSSLGIDQVIPLYSYKLIPYKTYTYPTFLVQKTVTESFEDAPDLVTETNYSYNEDYQIASSSFSNSENKVVEVKKYYASDINQLPNFPNASVIEDLKDNHRLTEPIQIELYKEGQKIKTQRIVYKDFGNGILLPWKKQIAKGDSNLFIDKIIYNKYDAQANPIEVHQPNGITSVYLWGYNHQKIVAVLENVTYQEVEDQFLLTPEPDWDSLLPQLEDLRNLVGFEDVKISTYKHAPLVGLVEKRDEKGELTQYNYDQFNRLSEIRDAQNKLLSEFFYNYINK